MKRFLQLSLILFISLNLAYAQWQSAGLSPDMEIVGIDVDGQTIVAATATHDVFVSTDGGSNWNNANGNLVPTLPIDDIKTGNGLIAVIQSQTLKISSDYGTNWVSASPVNVRSIFFNGTDMYAGKYVGIEVSHDDGSSWSPYTNSVSSVYQMEIGNGSMFALSQSTSKYLFRSDDDGQNWDFVPNLPISGTKVLEVFDVSGSHVAVIIADVINGFFLYVSSDNGNNWTEIGLSSLPGVPLKMHDILYDGNRIFISYKGFFGEKCVYSTDGGTSFNEISTGIPGELSRLTKNDTWLFSATKTNSVYKYDMSGIPTALEEFSGTPAGFALHQNYPNPFNPTTNITFSLSKAGFASLDIYNALGQKIESLVKENLLAGKYNYQWNASGYASGVYWYELRTATHTEMKKMILLR